LGGAAGECAAFGLFDGGDFGFDVGNDLVGEGLVVDGESQIVEPPPTRQTTLEHNQLPSLGRRPDLGARASGSANAQVMTVT
jgi:hypothetical protein